MSDAYTLNPYARVAQYGGAYYAYDRRLTDAPLVEIPTSQISHDEFLAGELLRTRGFLLEPRALEEISVYLLENGLDAGLAARLTDLRLLQRYETHAQAIERRVLEHFERRYLPPTDERFELPGPQDAGGAERAHHSFSTNTFFNLPRAVDAGECDVGLLGVPIASLRASLGTMTGPGHLRLRSRSLCWFDVHKNGVYSEISLDHGRPEVLCQGVVLRDCGDVDAEALTAAGLHERLRAALATEFFAPGVRPLVVGGDHAITGPIVCAYLDRMPDLGVLHLDAHNDLFYTPRVVYSHAAAISNLVRTTPIQRIASYGLRTFTDSRMAGIRSVYDDERAHERLRLRSLADTKRLVTDPGLLHEELEALADRPYYLTLDLDVLSDAAIGRRVSTPFGTGLEWHELFTFLNALFGRLEIVGCDVVEYNGLNGDGGEGSDYHITALLLFLIDRLARNDSGRAAAGVPRAVGRMPQKDAGVAAGPT